MLLSPATPPRTLFCMFFGSFALFMLLRLRGASALDADPATAAWVALAAERLSGEISRVGERLSPRAAAAEALRGVREGNLGAFRYESVKNNTGELERAAEAQLGVLAGRLAKRFEALDGYAKAVALRAQGISDALESGQYDSVRSLGDVGSFYDTSDPARYVPERKFDPRFDQHVSVVASTVKLSPPAVAAKDSDPLVARHIRALQDFDPTFKGNDPNNTLQDLKWQYFATAETGLAQFFPGRVWGLDSSGSAKDYFPRFRPWFADAAAGPKDMMILLDRSGSMLTNGRLQAAKKAIDTVIETLTPRDFVNVVAFADRKNTKSVLDCSPDRLVPATSYVLSRLRSSVVRLDADGDTDFTGAFEVALDIMNKSNAAGWSSGCQKILLFLTDGVSGDPTAVLDAYNRGPFSPLGVRVFSYTLGEQADPDIPTKVACNNRGTVTRIREVSSQSDGGFTGGDIRASMMSYYNFIGTGTPRWSAPYLSISLGVMVTRTYPIYKTGDGTLFGVAAIDVTISEVRDQVLNWFAAGPFPDGTYAFLVSGDGTAVVHPEATIYASAPRNDISELEMVNGANPDFVTRVRPRLLSRQRGSVVITMPRRIPRGIPSQGIDRVVESTTYVFEPITGTDFVLVLRMPSVGVANPGQLSENPTTPVSRRRLYHRILAYTNGATDSTSVALQKRWTDLGSPIIGQRAGDVSTVEQFPAYQVASRSFCDAATCLLSEIESPRQSLDVIDFVNNASADTDLECVSGSGWLLKNSIRAEVQVLSEAVETHVQRAGLRGQVNSSALWVYVGSHNGATIVWPGVDVESGSTKNYDCAERPWYRSAASQGQSAVGNGTNNTIRFVLSGPYEDAAGAGSIVTISSSIADPTNSALVAGVAGVDFRTKTLRKQLAEEIQAAWDAMQVPATGNSPIHNCSSVYDCSESPTGKCHVRCFLLDSAGFSVHDFSEKGEFNAGSKEAAAFGKFEPSAAQAMLDGGILSTEHWTDFSTGCPKPKATNAVESEVESPATRPIPWFSRARTSSRRQPQPFADGVLVPAESIEKSDCNLDRATFRFDSNLFGANGTGRLAALQALGLGSQVALVAAGSRYIAYVPFSTGCERGRAYISKVVDTNTFFVVLADHWSNPSRKEVLNRRVCRLSLCRALRGSTRQVVFFSTCPAE
jgi:von Willebrand factor type A domain